MALFIPFLFLVAGSLASPATDRGVCNQTQDLPVVQLPIQNVTLTGSNGRRGSPLRVGTPGQMLSFQPSILPSATCIVLNGGLFNENVSSSWLASSTMAQSGAASENTSSIYPFTMDTWGQDTLGLTSALEITSFPVDLTKQTSWAINALGLGMNSTVLNSLKSVRKIASSSWSMWYGLYGYGGPVNAQMDGTLVLGGYDAAKTMGPRLDFPVQAGTSCRTNLVVPLLDMTVDTGGQSRSILDKPQFACLDPGMTTLEVSTKVYTQFISLAGGNFLRNSSGLFALAPVFETSNAFYGNITLSLGSGFSITVPGSQLVLPEVGVDEYGAITANLTTREILITPPQSLNFNDQIVLGIPFFTAAYLLVNYDRQPPTFSLWKANANSSSELVALDADGSECRASTPATSAPASSNGSTSATDAQSMALSPGGIAGVVVGASAALAVIAGGWWWLARKRRGQARIVTDRAEAMSAERLANSLPPKLPHTAQARTLSVQEMDATRRTPVLHQLYSTPNER